MSRIGSLHAGLRFPIKTAAFNYTITHLAADLLMAY